MLHALRLVALLFVLPVTGWEKIDASPPVPKAEVVTGEDPIVWCEMTRDHVVISLHASGEFSAAALSDDGVPVCSTTAPQGQQPAPTPQITTQWIDAQGVTHTVSTPIAGTTEQTLTKAIQTHEALVQRMQQLHPPRPVPPP